MKRGLTFPLNPFAVDKVVGILYIIEYPERSRKLLWDNKI